MNVNSQVSRRRFLQISGMTAGAAFLAACTAMPAAPPAASTGGEAAAPAAAAKTMEAWSQMTDVAQESLKGIIDNYNKSNKIGAKLEFVYIAATQGSQSDEKLLTAIAGGNPPALHNADRFTVPQFAHQGFFTNVAENAKAAGVTADQYFDFAWQEASYKDGLYALPFDTDTRAYWYNKDIMKEAGPGSGEAAADARRAEDSGRGHVRARRRAASSRALASTRCGTRPGSTPGALPLRASSRIRRPSASPSATPTTSPPWST